MMTMGGGSRHGSIGFGPGVLSWLLRIGCRILLAPFEFSVKVTPFRIFSTFKEARWSLEPAGTQRAGRSQRSQEEPARARRSQEEPGETRESQQEPGGARMSQEEPGRARRSQEEPGGARSSQEEPGRARSSQEQLGEARGRVSQGSRSQEARRWRRAGEARRKAQGTQGACQRNLGTPKDPRALSGSLEDYHHHPSYRGIPQKPPKPRK